MSVLAVPANVTYVPGSVFAINQQALLNHVPAQPVERDLAARFLAKHAPDLTAMILGDAA